MSATRRIRTILYGDQRIEAGELDLLHTPALQRLYELHQLGLTDRIFVDASHSRLQHVVGVLEQVDNILDAITCNLERRPKRRLAYRDVRGQKASQTAVELANYVRKRKRSIRLMGLLHDLTHAPYGHTLEDEIELQPLKHDNPTRQAAAFYRLLCQYIGWVALDAPIAIGSPPVPANLNESALREYLDSSALRAPPENPEFISYLAEKAAALLADSPAGAQRTIGTEHRINLFRDLRFAMRALLWLDALHKDDLSDLLTENSTGAASSKDAVAKGRVLEDGAYAFEQLIDAILVKAGALRGEPFLLQRDAFFLDVIGNTICADLLDYAKRDSHFASLRLDYDVDRIVENFTLVSHSRARVAGGKNKRGYRRLEPMLRTAISIFSHKLRIDVPGELMNLLQVRFYVYQRVLFHPTKCIAGAMLGSAIQLLGWKELPQQYLFVGDTVFLYQIGEVARLLRDVLHDAAVGDPTAFVSSYAAVCSERLRQLPNNPGCVAALDLLTARFSEPVGKVLESLEAAITLLDRLSARRYHRPVFRLLPNVSVPELNVAAENVAEVFRDAKERAKVEREIESRAGLPIGTVTIHCPRADGPKKIAEILILSEQDSSGATQREVARPLREIGRIDSEIFAEHETALDALERMYASMWRLVVSVSPPFVAEYKRINKVIGRVLFSALSEDRYETVYEGASESDLDSDKTFPCVPNDRYMEMELAGIEQRDESAAKIRLIRPDGSEETYPAFFMDVATRAIERLSKADPRVASYVESGRFAAEGRRTDIEGLIDDLIASPRAKGPVRSTFDDDDAPRRQQRDLLDSDHSK